MTEQVGLVTKLSMMLVSLLLSCGLWMYVQITQPSNVRYMRLPVQEFNLENLPKNLIIRPIGKATIELTGPDEALLRGMDEIDKQGIAAVYVDVSNAHVGTDDYPLRLTLAKRDLPYKVRLADKTLSVTVEQRLSVPMPISVQEIGQIPQTMNVAFNGATPHPSIATVSGPVTAVRSVKKLRAFLDLSAVDISRTYPCRVDALDDHDQPVADVTVEPEDVSVAVGVAPAPLTATVLIEPVMNGQPALGYAVTDFTVEPNQIAIQGPPDILARVRTVRTRPIALGDLRETTTFEVPLDLPANVRSYSVQRVKVRVTIEAKATAGSAPQSVAGP